MIVDSWRGKSLIEMSNDELISALGSMINRWLKDKEQHSRDLETLRMFSELQYADSGSSVLPFVGGLVVGAIVMLLVITFI